MSSYVDATAGALEHCELMAQQQPDLAEPYYNKIASHCKERLWHQLTLTILDLVSHPTLTLRTTPEGTNSYLALYDKVMLSIDSKVNPLSLSRIAVRVANSLATTTTTTSNDDSTAAKAILENLLAKPDDWLNTPARIYVESKLSLLSLDDIMTTGTTSSSPVSTAAQNEEQQSKLASIKKIISSNAEVLKEMIQAPDTVESAIVHSAHYEMAMTYYKVLGPPEAFYEQAMSYLNYAPLGAGGGVIGEPTATTTTATTPPSTKEDAAVDGDAAKNHQLAVDLCLAALTGEGVYNFGQVATIPLLRLLRDTPDQWLYELLQCCVKANVLEFQELTQRYADDIARQPALVHRADAVKEKLTLLALLNLVFERASSERTLEFSIIAERLHIPVEQVEWVIMRAFSVHLLEGSMDQVEGTVSVTWVLPRVLDQDQLQALASRFGGWAVKVSKTKDSMQEQTPTFA